MVRRGIPIRSVFIADIERLYVHLATGFAIGAISSSEFAAAMEAFRFMDGEGQYWTVGAVSGRWYVHQGGSWRPAQPPPELLGPELPLIEFPTEAPQRETKKQPPEPAADHACPKCGRIVRVDAQFCTGCGTSLREARAQCQKGVT